MVCLHDNIYGMSEFEVQGFLFAIFMKQKKGKTQLIYTITMIFLDTL